MFKHCFSFLFSRNSFLHSHVTLMACFKANVLLKTMKYYLISSDRPLFLLRVLRLLNKSRSLKTQRPAEPSLPQQQTSASIFIPSPHTVCLPVIHQLGLKNGDEGEKGAVRMKSCCCGLAVMMSLRGVITFASPHAHQSN